MRQLVALGRGLAHRAGSAAMILVVAVVAAAAAAAGPVYYQAAQHSILADTLSSASFIGRGYEATLSGPVSGTLPALRNALRAESGSDFSAGFRQKYFEPPVDSIYTSGEDTALDETLTLAWQTDFCAHLVITGRCPTTADQVIVSKSATGSTGWHVGGQISASGWPVLTITGVYQPPNLSSAFWNQRGPQYFPREANPVGAGSVSPGLDAVFTSQSTMTHAPAVQQGTTVVDVSLALRRIPVSSVNVLRADLTTFVNSTNLSGEQVVVESAAPVTLAAVLSAWRAVAVPVSLITVTVLLLSWLLLFLIVTEAVEARGVEIALGKLRGHGPRGILVFGVSEPAVLLLAALPVGVLAGWVSAARLARVLLLPGTPASLPYATWAAAGAAVAGGLTAVLLAARRVLRRGVVEQLRQPSRLAAGRGWVTDSILLTGSVAGLVEVFSSNQIGSANHGVLQLLVPGLVGLAVAVIASRLLPLGCQALYGVTSRHGGLGSYLALRHIARRHGGIRTTIVLATAFCLAAFAFAAWSVGERNYRLVAAATVGAPDVLTVSVPPGRNLGAIVDKADPSGRLATAVDTYIGLSGGTAGEYTIGVDPGRFAKIAAWPPTLSARQVAALTAALRPLAAAPIVLTGDALRVIVDVSSMSSVGEQLYANVTTGATPVTLGTLPVSGAATFTAPLTGCPCTLQSLALTLPTGLLEFGQAATEVSGKLTIDALAVRQHGHWVPAAPTTALDTAANWRDETAGERTQSGPSSIISGGPQGLTWAIHGIPSSTDPTLGSADVPAPLPAIVAERLGTGGGQRFTGIGLDGAAVQMRALAALSWIPGAATNGVLVDRQYADIEAGYNLAAESQQAWLAPGALAVIKPRLLAAGVTILSQSSIAATMAQLNRQGPAVAGALFLADATAAALLAAGAAVAGLYVSARRRRYEYAALEASGIRRRTLRNALLIELAVVLGFGTIVGAATGLIAARLVLRSVPEFTSTPTEPLTYVPAAGPVAGLLGAAAALVISAVVLSSVTLIRGVRADLLREAPA
jgi:putative ABC transport system permease protein